MIAYTDGATSNNGYDGARGGWAFIIVDEYSSRIIHEESGYIENATNNICELTAIIKAVKFLSRHYFYERNVIYSDSAYCINCYKQKWYKKWIQNGWINSQKKPVANKELWELLIPFFESPFYSFEKVIGHSTNYWNIHVDNLAVQAKFKEN